MITKTLRMSFTTAGQRTVTVTLPDPLDTLTEAQVRAAMQMIIDKDVVNSPSGVYVAIREAVVDVLDRTAIIARTA